MSSSIKGTYNINKNFISGWCFDENKTDIPLVLELFVNGKKIAEETANKTREDLVKKDLHPTGNVGYKFLVDENLLNENSKVELRVKGSSYTLKTQRKKKQFKDSVTLGQIDEETTIKKKRLCIVHIGMHKTGSSSIQHNLNKKQNKNFSYFDLGVKNHSIPIYSLFSEVPENYHIHKRKGLSKSQVDAYNLKVDRMFKEHLLTNSQHDIFVISGEDISVLSKRSLEHFKNYLLGFFETIKIVAYVRSPIGYINSAFQQVVKGGLSKFSDGVNNNYPQYKNRFEKFDLLFGKENVFLSYFDKDHLIDKDVTLDFIKRNNLEVDAKTFTKTNESLSLEAVSLLYVYNKFGPKPVASIKNAQEHHMLVAALTKIGSKKFLLGKKVLQPIIDEHKQDIEWIEDRMGMKLLDDKTYPDNGGIECEDDLFEAAKLSINELKKAIGEENITKEINGDTVQDIVELVHMLYLKSVKEKRLTHRK